MESGRKYRSLMEKEELLRTEEDGRLQAGEKVKEKQASIDEQEKTILDLKNQIEQIKKVKRTRNLFLALGIILIIILANVLLYFYYDKELTHEIDKYQAEIKNKESVMEEQLQQMQVNDIYTE